ncbi:uncharacterized protein [Aristolochia californica]|uniref:uncharacterized protein n=1 Tax=Aristolochia californica TaxID=171875 RepID=UPI0035DD5C2E
MGNGGSKPESSDGVVQAGLLTVRRRIDEIRHRRKMRHRDSILSTTELLKAEESAEVALAPEKDASAATESIDGPVLLSVPESDSLTETESDGEENQQRDSDDMTLRVRVKKVDGEETELGYADMPKSPSFRHFAKIDTPADSDESGNDDHHEKTSEEALSTKEEKKKKKGRKIFARRPSAVCGLLHVQSCYSIPQDSPKTEDEDFHRKEKACEKTA